MDYFLFNFSGVQFHYTMSLCFLYKIKYLAIFTYDLLAFNRRC